MMPELKIGGKKRVAAYARVSTSRNVQLGSLHSQQQYYLKKIEENPNWEPAGIFTDEGISGTSLKGRDGLNEIMKLSGQKKIDLVITKSVSRFARNTADLLKTVRKLKDNGTGIFFEKENLSSVSGDGELMLSLMGVFAQSESESISSNIMWRIEKDRKNGISTPHSRVCGYRWRDGKLVLQADEANVISDIYSMYEKGMSGRAIADFLNGSPLPDSLKGRHFDSTSIYYILRNPVYCGDLLMGKYYTTSPIDGRKRKNRGERDMYLVPDDHDALIEKTRWKDIQNLIAERTGMKNAESKDN